MAIESVPYGEANYGERTSTFNPHTDAGEGFQSGAWNGAPYTGRGKRCTGNNNTCLGWKVKGTEFCNGHLMQIAKKGGPAPEVVETA